jgi:carboxyl-terminal processing protease
MRRFLVLFFVILIMGGVGCVSVPYIAPVDGTNFAPILATSGSLTVPNNTASAGTTLEDQAVVGHAAHAAPTTQKEVDLDLDMPTNLILQLFGLVFYNSYPPLLPEDATDDQVSKAFEKFAYDLMEGGFSQATGDHHSHYFSPERTKDYQEQARGSFDGGVGVSLIDRGLYILITQIVPNSPAADSGEVRPGDIILAVNGSSVAGKPLNDVVNEIRGEIATEVVIKIGHGNKERVVTLKRAKIVVPMVIYEDVDPTIAYVKVLQFGTDVSQKFFNAARPHLKDKKLLIVDLRNNPGGDLREVHRMSCFFADRKEDVAITIRDRAGTGTLDCVAQENVSVFKDVRVVVLVNGYSASASEIFSGVLQNWHKAIIVGENTFGKGSVQMIVPLPDKNHGNSEVHLTVAEYFVGNNFGKVNKIGIRPDRVVHNAAITTDDDARYLVKNTLDPTNDAQLAMAIKVVWEMSAQRDLPKKK